MDELEALGIEHAIDNAVEADDGPVDLSSSDGEISIVTKADSLVVIPEGNGDSVEVLVEVIDVQFDDLSAEQTDSLDEGEVVLGALTVDVKDGGTSVVELPGGGMVVSILLPEGTAPGTVITIKIWDPKLGWLSLETTVSADDYAVAPTPFAGTFILTGK